MCSIYRKVLFFQICAFLLFELSYGLTFTRSTRTYAKFPKWNACVNSSISFEFKTSVTDGLLMYTDDNGNYDYVEVTLKDGRVRLRMNIVDGKDGTVEITLGQRVNDQRWHHVEIQRNRMETTLHVDGFHDSRVAFGSDFHFGDVTNNNFVYFAGLPTSYHGAALRQLSLTSAFFEQRFVGQLRNVIYGNCTCKPERASMIDGASVSRQPQEACEVKDDCGKCLCISGDDGPGCQCVGFDCPADVNTHYKLPMDRIAGDAIQNPSGLDAKVTGSPRLVPGASGNAIRIDCSVEKVKVSGPGHREECFGDLSRCLTGYTLMFWVRFDSPGRGKGVYLSNGGERQDSHGVAMMYDDGMMYWIFRMQTGREWRVQYRNILTRRWYHVTVTWNERTGLVLYVNGNKVAQDSSPSTRQATLRSPYNDFVIGQPNDDSDKRDLGIMTIDELQFWSQTIQEHMLREKGPIYNYHLPMDKLQDGHLIIPNLEPITRGRLRQVPGKIGNAIKIPGQGEYIDLGSFTDSCLGNTSVCLYGFTVAFWINIAQLKDNSYYISSGLYGFAVFSYGNRLYASVQNGDRQWQTTASGIQTKTWYFVEVTWDKTSGLELYLNQKLESAQRTSAHHEIKSTRFNNFYIGRANTVMFEEKYATATLDDLQLYNADRDRLLALDFIQRGKPDDHYYGFDAMSGSRIEHPTTVLDTSGGVRLAPGRIGKAVWLTGDRQTVAFDHGDGCLGNLDYCRHGIMLAIWIKLDKTVEGMFYLSSAMNGVELSVIDKKFRVTTETSTRKWEVMTSAISALSWYFLEITWSSEDGLKLYANGMMIKEDKTPKEKLIPNDDAKVLGDRFWLGRDNAGRSGSVFGAALYDEMEFWEGPRDYLLAFGYIQRGKPEHYVIHMDAITENGKSIPHASLPISLNGYPVLVPGKVNNAIQLDGNQYIDIGQHEDKCIGNLDLCRFGISIFFWLKIKDYDSNMYLLSTGRDGIRLYYNQDFIYVTLNNKRKSWRVSVPRLPRNEWYYMELSWHPEFGMQLFIDGILRGHVTARDIPEQYGIERNHFYVGRPNAWDVQGQRFTYGNMVVDELEVWYARRDALLAFDYILRDNVGYESFSMETASNDVIDHPHYRVTLEHGARLVPGKVGNAVALQGRGQYVDLGEHMDKCFANLDTCNNGLTVSLLIKPQSLRTNQYFLSGPTYSVYLQNGQLKADFYSGGKHWNVTTRNFEMYKWNDVVLSWDMDMGLIMYLGDKIVDKNDQPEELPQGDDARASGNVYIGKSSDSTVTSDTAVMVADEVQYWLASLDKLRKRGLYSAGPIHETIPLSQMPRSGVLRLPGRRISLEGGASLGTSGQKTFIRLNGKGQYINMGENLTCHGDLTNCPQGFTLRFGAKPDKLTNNMYFLDSYPLSIFYRDGRLYATVRAEGRSWTVGAPGFQTREWQNVDVSWHPEKGLTMFVNEDEVGAHKTHGTAINPVYDFDRRTYIGRAMTDMLDERYANTAVGNFEIWNVRRDVLESKNLLNSDSPDTSGGTIDGARGGSDVGGGVDVNTERATLPTINIVTPEPTIISDDAASVVVVTSLPDAGNTQDSRLGTRLLKNTVGSTSKVIRFLGNSHIRYEFRDLASEMTQSTDKETMSLQFITQMDEGLIWILKDAGGRKMHLSMVRGQLVFVLDDGRGSPQRVNIPSTQRLNDFSWHVVRVEKDGRTLKFFLDNAQAAQMVAASDVQFVGPNAQVYLGGVGNPQVDTGGVTSKNFDGALVDVETKKVMGPNRDIIISFLQYIGATTGDIKVIDPDDWNNGYEWGTARPPPTTTPRPQPTPVTFKTGSSMFYLREALDMRSGGTIGFRFRTQEPRGLMVIGRSSAQSVEFFAIEIFDGILYFVYDLGSVTSRKMFSDQRVDDGEWHEVKMGVRGTTLTLTLDGRSFSVPLSQTDARRLYFYRVFFGGYEDYSRAPWPLYSRQGYKGCMEGLQVNEIGYDLHLFIRNQALTGVEIGCRAMASFCQAQPCASGYCRDRMDGYICGCADTPYTGRNCDVYAPVAGWDGTYSTIFNFLNRESTHTNDMSFRFNTPLRDTILFRTEADKTDDYIQAELVDGRGKVTIKVDGQTKTFLTGNNLNDYYWHTLHIRRRADDVQVWVDNEAPMAGVIGGENFKLIIDRIKFGSFDNVGNYIGYMQNFIYDDKELFTILKSQTSDKKWIVPWPIDNLPTLTYKPVTITTSDTFFQLPSMRIGLTMKLLFKFKTRESNGLILYNDGTGNDVIAVEMSDGRIRLAYNLGGRNMFTVVPTPNKLNDNKWHTVQVSLNERGQFSVRVDNETLDVTTSDGDGLLNLSGSLYVGGMPAQMYQSPAITSLITSRKGFRGCLASVDLNGAVPELMTYARDRTKILDGCTDLAMTCKPNACGPGVCMPSADSYWCNCNMTGFVGIPCTDYPTGYYFGKQGNNGVIVYEFPYEKQVNSDQDMIAFGFMTEQEDGVLYRVESSLDTKDFIEIRLENGFLIAESNTGSGLTSVSERAQKFNDGQYHVVRYIRTGKNTTLQVNQLPMQTVTHSGTATLFNKVYRVIIGGRMDAKGAQMMNFKGIVGGAYYNNHRWMDLLLNKQLLHNRLVQIRGDVVLTKPFLLVKGGVKTTAAPPDIVLPPGGVIPTDIGGGGVIGTGIGGGGGGPPSVVAIGGPGGPVGVPTGVGVDVVGGPVAQAAGLFGPAPPVTGARAGAVVGTVLGTLAFLSSLMWAMYKLKPGVPTCFSPGAGKAGGAGMSISSPRATSNLAVVQAASAPPPKAANGSPAAAGGGSSTYTSYFQSTSTAVGGGGAAAGGGGTSVMVADDIDSSTLRATGAQRRTNMSSSGYSGNYQSNTMQSSSANYQSNTMNSQGGYQSNTMQSYGSGAGGGGSTIDRSYESRHMASTSGDNIPDYDMPMPGTMQSGQSYSSTTLNTHYNYQLSGSSHYARSASPQPSANTHTSVLNLILTSGKFHTIKPRSDIYSAALAPAPKQGFVDRAEDLLIEEMPVKLTVRSLGSAQAAANAGSRLNVDGIQINTNAESGTHSAKYTRTTYNVPMGSDWHVQGSNTVSTTRKTSLTIPSLTQKSNFGYERLGSSTSENNINDVTTSKTTSTHVYNDNQSLDNLYESTMTIVSNLRSESADTGLDLGSIDGLGEISFNSTDCVLDVDIDRSLGNGKTDYVYSKVNKTSAGNTNSTHESSKYNVTCSAQLKENKSPANEFNYENEEAMSGLAFDKTIKEFEQFVDIDTNLDDKLLEVEMTTAGMNLSERQTDRSEEVIENTAASFVRTTSRPSKGDITPEGTVTSTSYDICETSFTVSGNGKGRQIKKQHALDQTSFTVSRNEGQMNEQTLDLESELTDSVKALLTGINVDTNKWDYINVSTGKGSNNDYGNSQAISIGDCDPVRTDYINVTTDIDVDLDGAVMKVQNLKTVTMNKQGQYVMSSAGGAVTPGAAADEVRVDCCLMTGDGRSVVTGSSLGPPQVWDIQTGELQNIMKGDTIGSTNLHLVCGDRLLVGAVHADMEINEYSSRKGVFNHTLQIWDCMTGRPLSMAEGEYCSALCPMSDSDKVLFGRTDKFGDATSIIAWDLMGNQMIKEMRYDAPVGNNDYISYLNKSKNDRYIVAGFTNSFDHNAEFMAFDMTLTSYNISEPSMLKLDANPEVTAILPKDEAVTGLRNGDLVIWSIRTAQPSRQLLGSGGAHAHSKEVKSVCLSDDERYLVSGSADGTLKVWDMHTERPIHTLQGHTDEVWCTAISNDNEIVVSGSADGTIRLWRMKNGTEMCVFNCGVDIFNVNMSRDKGTIVALGDKFGARKLIMLQVVRTKIKKIVSS